MHKTMKNGKQTAVEWLEHEFYKFYYDINFKTFEEFDSQRIKLWEQAKAMEKEQIKDAFTDGCIETLYELNAYYTSEKYYNQAYKQQDKCSPSAHTD